MSHTTRRIILIAHNLRSCHNVGSLLRTAEGLGVERVILSGYSPHPAVDNDNRMPHEVIKLAKQIHKTALGAEDTIGWDYQSDIFAVLKSLRDDDWHLAAVEQADTAITLPDFQPPDKLVLLVGREVEGVEPEVLETMDAVLEIPMFGQKESFNVVQAAAMGLYHCRFTAE